MSLIEAVREAWGWCGVDPVEVVGENEFGNLIIEDASGRCWRLSPEDLYCRVIAQDREEFYRLSRDQVFLHDWYMRALVDTAFQRLGVLPEARKYCMKIPGALGGEYEGSNLATIGVEELVRALGDIARQIKDLPDGAKVRMVVSE